MKKSDILKCLGLCLCIAIISFVIILNYVNETEEDSVAYRISEKAQEISKGYDELSKLMTKNNPEQSIVNISIEIPADKLQLKNNKLAIKITEFINYTNNIYNSEFQTIKNDAFECDIITLTVEDDNTSIYLVDVAYLLGYKVSGDEVNGVTISRMFYLKRIMVSAEEREAITNTYGAAECLNISGLYVLQYNTEYATFYAYNQFVSLGYSVFPDEVLESTAETIDYKEAGTDLTNYVEGRHYTWGYSYMGFEEYAKYLASLGKLKESVVAVLDTGVDANHRLLKGRVINSKFSGNMYELGLTDDDGHGTHVAGIIADLTPNNVSIISYKVLGKSSSTHMVALKSIIELKKAGLNITALNGSYTYLGGSGPEGHYTSTLQDMGVACCFSAGNDSKNAKLQYPGAIKEVITVSAIGTNKSIASFSNYGENIDFTAPGQNIESAKANFYETIKLSGTSMSSPHLAASCALIASQPNTDYSFEEVYALLKKSCIDLGNAGFDINYGWGCPKLSNLVPKSQKTKEFRNVVVEFEVQNVSPYISNYEDVSILYHDNNNVKKNKYQKDEWNGQYFFKTNDFVLITFKETITWSMDCVYLGNNVNNKKVKYIPEANGVIIEVDDLSLVESNYLTIVLRNDQMAKVKVNLNYCDDTKVNSDILTAFDTTITANAYDEGGKKYTKEVKVENGYLHRNQVVTFDCNKGFDNLRFQFDAGTTAKLLWLYNINGILNPIKYKASCYLLLNFSEGKNVDTYNIVVTIVY